MDNKQIAVELTKAIIQKSDTPNKNLVSSTVQIYLEILNELNKQDEKNKPQSS